MMSISYKKQIRNFLIFDTITELMLKMNFKKISLLSSIFIMIFFTGCSQINNKNLNTTGWYDLIGNSSLDGSNAYIPQLANSSSNEIYLGYQTWTFTDGYKIKIKKHNGSAWTDIGSSFIGQKPSFIIYNDVPYVGFIEVTPNERISIKKFDGSNWVYVGPSNFSISDAKDIKIFINNNIIYAAYIDKTTQTISVYKYNGTTWTLVGNSNISGSSASYLSLSVDSTGTPFVAFQDGGVPFKLSVMKFNGTNWVFVGTRGFTSSTAEYISLKNYGGEPYVTYMDANLGSKTSVMKYNGTSWVPVGNLGFSNSESANQKLFINTNGNLYVTFNEFNSPWNTVVMMWDGSGSWKTVGSYGIANGSTVEPYVHIADVPYIAYKESGSALVVKKHLNF